MSDSSIEWTDKTWNPVTGCTKVSEGCRHCYAERLFPKVYPGRKFTDVQLHVDRLEYPHKWRKPCMVFVNSMSDLFHDDIPDDFIRDVFWTMQFCERHTFQVLTKRPNRMAGFLNDEAPTLPNVWLGVSAENQERLDERAYDLLDIEAAVRFFSLEPLLGPITHIPGISQCQDCGGCDWRGIDRWCNDCGAQYLLPGWIIVGGESGPKARPMHPDWVREIRSQCQEVGVPFFFKQWGAWSPLADPHEHPSSEWKIVRRDGTCWRPVKIYRSLAVEYDNGRESVVVRVGKKAAGRLLDGREWNEMPKPAREKA